MEKNISISQKIAKEIHDLVSEKNSATPNLQELIDNEPQSLLTLIERLNDTKRLEMIRKFRNESQTVMQPTILLKKIEQRRIKIKQQKFKIAKLIAVAVFSAVSILMTSYFIEDTITQETPKYVVEYTRPAQPVLMPTLVTMRGEYKISNHTEIKDKNGKYEISNDAIKYSDNKNVEKEEKGKKTEWNKIIIPRGFKYNVTLADGTLVTLNSGSELGFPTTFGDSIRKVTLKGEAFFDVAKSKNKFIVSVDNVEVSVYGTKFNLSNVYDGRVELALVEGAVSVAVEDGVPVMVNPNQLATIIRGVKEAEISKINNIENYTAWLCGDFIYTNKSLLDIAVDLSNWYGVDLEIPSDMLKLEVSLFARRTQSINEIVKLLESAINVKFTKKGVDKYVIEK